LKPLYRADGPKGTPARNDIDDLKAIYSVGIADAADLAARLRLSEQLERPRLTICEQTRPYSPLVNDGGAHSIARRP
jgi:hypothetical protein